MKEIRQFGKIKGHYQLYGNITNNDYNLALCKLYGLNPKNVKGLKEEYNNMEEIKAIIPIELLDEIAMLTNLLEEKEEGTEYPQEYKSKLKMTLSQIENKLSL